MSLDRQNLISFQSIRRIFLSVLTAFILFKLIFSLIDTLDRPQIQGKFELYQTNLVLVASEWKPTADLGGLGAIQTAVVGTDILDAATQQYQTARTSDVQAIDKLSLSLTDLPAVATDRSNQPAIELQTKLINKTISAAQLEIDKIDLRIGILQAVRKESDRAILHGRGSANETWQKVIANSQQATSKNTARLLIEIWKQPSGIDSPKERLRQR